MCATLTIVSASVERLCSHALTHSPSHSLTHTPTHLPTHRPADSQYVYDLTSLKQVSKVASTIATRTVAKPQWLSEVGRA